MHDRSSASPAIALNMPAACPARYLKHRRNSSFISAHTWESHMKAIAYNGLRDVSVHHVADARIERLTEVRDED
jgi:hypothetical protein